MTSAFFRSASPPISLIFPRLALVIALGSPLSPQAQEASPESCEPDADGESAHCTSTGASTDPQPGHRLDWVPIDQLPQQLRDRLCLSCGGHYIDPLANEDPSASPEESDLNATAAQTEMQGDEIHLSGGVSVRQGYRRLRGEQALINREDRSGTLMSEVIVREPGVLLRGREAHFDADTGEASLDIGEFVLHRQHLRGSAAQLRRDEQGLIHIEEGKLTYCAPGDNDWAIQADSMVLDLESGLATARGAQLRIEGLPILYTPWLSFPLDDRRRSGLLWPNIGSDSEGGIDISAPIYLNLAPNYDALYAPRYIQERGFNHEIELRHLSDQFGLWSVGGGFMADDQRYDSQHPAASDSRRWVGFVQQNGLFQDRWRSRVDYGSASDVDYFKDLENANLDSKRQTSLLQLASLDYLGDRWLVGMDFQQYQSLADDINDDYKKLPQITGQYRGNNIPFAVEPVLLAQYSYFDTDDGQRVTGQRVYAEAGARYPMLWQSGFLETTAKYRYLAYELNERDLLSVDNPSSGSALASIDGGLYFERRTGLGGKSLLQTLEPRIYYVYSEYEAQLDQPDFDSAELTFSYNQLFRETRFAGRDRLDDANQLSIGLTTRLISDEDGRERFNASLGQVYYLDDRRVRLNPDDPVLRQSSSEIAGELNFYPNKRLSWRTSLVWDPDSGGVNAGNLQTSYQRDDGSVFNVGYYYRRPLTLTSETEEPPTEQVHFSTYLPVTDRWRLFAAVNYSVEAGRSIEDMFGVAYDTCCWQVRLLHLRYFDTVSGQNPNFNDPSLERDYSTQVQIVLKGMGGFGNRVSSLLQNMIRGFEDREN